jgi:predicted site-specific integrase-resolvase
LNVAEEQAGENKHEGLTVGICTRVSTSGQAKGRSADSPDSDLSRQKERLEEYAKLHFKGARVVHYSRTTSGLNYDSPVLHRLVRDLVNRRVNVILCTSRDRLLRYGVQLLQVVAKEVGAQIIFTEAEPEKSDSDELYQDIGSLIFLAQCSMHGKRSAGKNKVEPSPEILFYIFHLHFQQKLSTYAIVTRPKQENKDKDSKGRTPSRRIIRRCIAQNKPLATAIDGERCGNPSDVSPAYILSEFAAACLRQTGGKRKVLFSKVKAAFRQWCKAKGHGDDVSSRTILRFLSSKFPDCEVSRETTGEYNIAGLWIHKDNS